MKKLLFALLILPVIAFAQLPAPLRNTYVHDYAHILTADQIQGLNRTIYNIDTANKVKLIIILINELPVNYSIEDYAREIGEKWKVGKGVIYVAAINERKQRLEVSAHMEGVIPDIKAKHITDNIKPYFKEKNYYSGLMGMINSINVLIKDDVLTDQKVVEKTTTVPLWLTFLIIVIGSLGIIIYFERRRKRKLREFEKHLAAEKEKLNARAVAVNKIKYSSSTNQAYTPTKKDFKNDRISPTIIYTPPSNNDDYSSRSSNSSDDYSSGSSSNNDYNSSSDSNTDSYSGGGASNDW